MAAILVDELSTLTSALTGCPDPSQGNAIVMPGIAGAKICHTLRDGNGGAINLAAFVPSSETTTTALTSSTTMPQEYQHHVLLINAICAMSSIIQVPATIAAPSEGLVCFDMPQSIANSPGIYQVEWQIVDQSNKVKIYDKGLLSVEPTISHRSIGQIPSGPLTFSEIRLRLRDYPELNEYWGNYEYSADEILHAILEPIKFFNEMVPHSISFSPEAFPFRHAWLEAVVARLLFIGGSYFLREERTVQYQDNKQDSSQGKAEKYISIAQAMWDRYAMFCKEQKVLAHWSGGSISFAGRSW